MSGVPPPWDDSTPLGEVRDWLRDLVVRTGASAKCPCCKQNVKIYHRPLGHATARAMIFLWLEDEGRDWTYLPGLFNRRSPLHGGTGDATKGRWWGLMEQEPSGRPDGSKRNGWWRLTDLGREWVTEKVNVPQKARLYNERCLGLEGPPWSVRQALNTKFNYDDLMRGV